MWEDRSSPPALTVTAGVEGPGEAQSLTQGSHTAQTVRGFDWWSVTEATSLHWSWCDDAKLLPTTPTIWG